MLIRVNHITRYAYAEPVGYAVQCLRLTPASFRGQRVVDWRVRVEGAGEVTQFKDGHGNLVHLATIAVEHRALTIEAEGTVETRDTSGVVDGLASAAPPRIYLRVTELTRPLDAIRELAHSVPATDSLGRLHALSAAIADRVAHVLSTSDAGTSAAEALAAGKGVCRDHAHIFIAAARALAIPARYVTGYVLLEPEAVAAAHHAWAEAWVEGLGWVGFDVANRVCPTQHHVRLATGLDAMGAAPVIGARRGGAAERLEVSVLVQQQQNAQQ